MRHASRLESNQDWNADTLGGIVGFRFGDDGQLQYDGSMKNIMASMESAYVSTFKKGLIGQAKPRCDYTHFVTSLAGLLLGRHRKDMVYKHGEHSAEVARVDSFIEDAPGGGVTLAVLPFLDYWSGLSGSTLEAARMKHDKALCDEAVRLAKLMEG